ncbi:MAG TPA: polysaccharide biosynthesis tyrosine autokinase [Gemmataceae bacterium]|nr:polysaccharide biosynthesis tyrosine autokinase [Gemmataceae bacterium]
MIPQDANYPEPNKNNPPTPRQPAKAVAGRIEARRGRTSDALLAPVPAALSSAPDVSSYLQALKRRWVSAAAIGGTLAVLAALTAWFLLSPKYIAFGRIRVAFISPKFNDSPSGNHGDFMTYLKTQANLLTGRPVISAALKKDEIKALNLEAFSGKDPAQYLEEELKVEFQENQELVTLLMSSSDPKVSLAIVKAVIDSYMDEIVYAEQTALRNRVVQMDQALRTASAKLKKDQNQLDSLVKQAGETDAGMLLFHLQELQDRIRQAHTRQNDLRLNIRQAEADLASHVAKMKAAKDAAVSPSIVEAALKNDPQAQRLKAEIAKHQETVDDFEQKAGGSVYLSHINAKKRVKAAQEGLKKRQKEVETELAQAVEAGGSGSREELELVRVSKINAIKAMKQHHDELGKDLEEYRAKLKNMKLVDHAEQDRLRENINRVQKFVDNLDLKLHEEELELQAPARVSKHQDAELQKKDMKKQLLGVIVSPVVVLLGVCMGVAWLDVRQRRIRSAGEVSRGLGIRVVGAVPSVPNLEHHLVGPTGEPDLEGHPALESIDALRTQLLRDADDEHTRVVMVTSATHGEGKTTVASHLASSLARAGRRTLLIDGDLRRPSAHQLFELPMHPGFSEVLLSEVELTDAVQTTTLDGLSFMAAGQWDREVLHALARDGVEGIFEKLQQEFDFVVIDSHPVLAATDSLLIGQRVDAVILSVLREVSQMPRVYAASQRLTTLGIRVLGAVVNGADPEEALAATAHARMVAH